MNINEKIDKREVSFKGNFLTMEKLYVTLPNGKKSTRDIIRHPGAVAILAINSKGEILIEEQYRAAIDEVILEIPAGKLEKGEEPKLAAIRELKEETGFSCKKIEKLGDVLLAAGYSDEVINIYLATDLEEGDTNFDEDEFINKSFIPLNEVKSLIKNGEIKDSKTIAAIMYYSMR